jgi:hypothetical protein
MGDGRGYTCAAGVLTLRSTESLPANIRYRSSTASTMANATGLVMSALTSR